MAELKIQVKADITGIEKLIDQLKDLQTYKMYEGADQTLVDLDDVVKIFADHVEAEVAQPQWKGEWIPCEERMPKVGQTVICQCRADILKLLKLDSGGDWYQDAEHAYMSRFVIAWMPLPKPYKEKRQWMNLNPVPSVGQHLSGRSNLDPDSEASSSALCAGQRRA